jgi:hypothetical protein
MLPPQSTGSRPATAEAFAGAVRDARTVFWNGPMGVSIAETVLPRLGSSLSANTLPIVVVLDDVHLLQNWECLDAVAALIEHLPQGSQLVIAGPG